jgi:hypothetical protein
MRLIFCVLVLSVCGPLAAKSITYPVSVPMECMELAQREHVPTMIESRMQGLKAEYKLNRLNKSDPLVVQCRDAVARLKAQEREK